MATAVAMALALAMALAMAMAMGMAMALFIALAMWHQMLMKAALHAMKIMFVSACQRKG